MLATNVLPGDHVDGRLIEHCYMERGVYYEPGEFDWAEFENAEVVDFPEMEAHLITGEPVVVLETNWGSWAVPGDLEVGAAA